jgi:hypothetical protein
MPSGYPHPVMPTRDPWSALAVLAANPSGRRHLVPMLGSGFVAQAVSEARAAKKSSPPNWPGLLRMVAKTHGLRGVQRLLDPKVSVPGQTALLWERMVLDLGAEGAAHEGDLALRKTVARHLKADAETRALARPFVDGFFALGFEHAMTFCFDSVLLDGEKPKASLPGVAKQASWSAPRGAATVWFPHGHESKPESIVLGAHAYGARLESMREAFRLHAARQSRRKGPALDSFVGVALERPLLFLGLSLSREEWTLWWLLAQRARYRKLRGAAPAFAVVCRPRRDDAQGLAEHASLARAADVVGLQLLEVDAHAEGWARVREALRWSRADRASA